MVYLLNFANETYESIRQKNTESAYKIAHVDKVFECSIDDIDSEYIEVHDKIFRYKRGCGLWLWKPYLIIKTLENLEDQDWLFYCDAGAVFINSIKPLIEFAEKEGTDSMFFELPLLAREFTKRETLIELGYDDCCHNQVLASYMLLRKSERTLKIIREWHSLCEKEELLSPEVFCHGIKERPIFGGHREDQSLLDIVVRKNGLKVYRDPSDYGEFPFHYQIIPSWTYNEKSYPECNYPTILLGVRNFDPERYAKRYKKLHFIKVIGLYNSKIYFAKRHFLIWLKSESFIHDIYIKVLKFRKK